eukprot:scaffold6532_cov116-Isochrysis_galbana.AAC.8
MANAARAVGATQMSMHALSLEGFTRLLEQLPGAHERSSRETFPRRRHRAPQTRVLGNMRGANHGGGAAAVRWHAYTRPHTTWPGQHGP